MTKTLVGSADFPDDDPDRYGKYKWEAAQKAKRLKGRKRKPKFEIGDKVAINIGFNDAENNPINNAMRELIWTVKAISITEEAIVYELESSWFEGRVPLKEQALTGVYAWS